MYCVFIYTYELHVHLYFSSPLSFSSKTPPFGALVPFSFILLMNCTCKGSSIPLDRGSVAVGV